MSNDKQSFQKPVGQQHSNWSQKESQPSKPQGQGGHQQKPQHGMPSDRNAGQGNFGKK